MTAMHENYLTDLPISQESNFKVISCTLAVFYKLTKNYGFLQRIQRGTAAVIIY